MGGFNTSVPQPSPAALDLKPPQVGAGPLDILSKLQETRMRSQAMQTQALQQQELQLNLAQRKAVNDAYQQAFTPQPDGSIRLDTDKLSNALATAGHGEAIPGILEGYTKYQQSLAGLQETNQKVAAAEADAAGNLAATVKAANNDPSLFHSLLTDAVNRRIINPQHFAPFDQAIGQAMQQDPTGEQARALVGKFTDQMIAGSPKQQELANAKATAQARQTQAQTGEKRLELETPGIQAGNTVKQQEATGTKPIQPAEAAQIANTQATRAETARHNQVEEQQGGQRVGIERENANRQQRQFDATYGALLSPDGKPLDADAAKAVASQDPMAVAVANYQIPPPNAGRSGPGAGILRKVMAINPQYNAQNWQAQSAMMKGYTSGSQSKEISGINTALGHIGQLGDAIDALKNGNIQVLNKIANAYGVQTGNDAVTTYRAIVHKVAPEINRAYVGGVGSQGEVMTQESDFDPKMGDQQLRSNVGITTKLLRSKIGSLENQWKNTMGTDFESRFITPEAKQVSDKWGSGGKAAQPQMIRARDPQGVLHEAPKGTAIPAGWKLEQ